MNDIKPLTDEEVIEFEDGLEPVETSPERDARQRKHLMDLLGAYRAGLEMGRRLAEKSRQQAFNSGRDVGERAGYGELGY